MGYFLCDVTQVQKLHYDPIQSAPGHRGTGLCYGKHFARWEQNWLKVQNFKWAQRLPNGKVSSCKIMQDVPK